MENEEQNKDTIKPPANESQIMKVLSVDELILIIDRARSANVAELIIADMKVTFHAPIIPQTEYNRYNKDSLL